MSQSFRTIVSSLTYALTFLAFCAYLTFTGGQSGFALNVTPGAIAPATTQGSPAAVLEQHASSCWAAEQRAQADWPGHVIWQHPDGRTVYSQRLTGRALDTQFGTGHLPGTLIAFCK